MLVLMLGPTLLAAFTTKTSPVKLLVESLSEPELFGTALEPVHPQLVAFSGPFFFLTCVWNFAEGSKYPWLRSIEDAIKRHGGFCQITALFVTTAAILVGTAKYGPAFIITGFIGTGFFFLLEFGKKKFIQDEGRPVERAIEAIRLFVVIEAIESAFSIDTMIGAVAMSSSIIAVLVGLTAGVLLIRTAVVHVVETDKLHDLVFMQSGAHWSMGLLGVLMLLTPLGIDTPAWIEEVAGGGIVAVALIQSVLRLRRTD
jgi:hypothetical protein